jgi:hypothetical protein
MFVFDGWILAHAPRGTESPSLCYQKAGFSERPSSAAKASSCPTPGLSTKLLGIVYATAEGRVDRIVAYSMTLA